MKDFLEKLLTKTRKRISIFVEKYSLVFPTNKSRDAYSLSPLTVTAHGHF